MTSEATNLSFARTGSGLIVWIHVSPRAKRPGIGGTHDGALRVAVREPPAAGAANAACVRALSDAFGVGRAAVEIETGGRSRRKRVRLSGEPQGLEETLQRLARAGRQD